VWKDVVAMTNGPIEFMGEGELREVPSTEMGGADGLIQPTDDRELRGDPEASGGHDLESDKRQALSEVSGILRRRAAVPLTGREQLGEVEPGMFGDEEGTGEPVDPVTGRKAPASRNVASGGVGSKELGDLKPK
jgi:hypothetical protein